MGLIVITGASAGIGAAAAVELTRRGRRVLATGRSAGKLRAVHRDMLAAAPRGLGVPAPIPADLAELRQVRELAEQIITGPDRLDVLVNNAGVQPSRRQVTADGFELAFAVNHLAPFLLTELLADRIRTDAGRVVITASSNHAAAKLDLADPQLANGWSPGLAYANSKLANILFGNELRRRMGFAATAFHPGTITTDLNRDSRFVRVVKPFERFVMASPERGAATLVWLADGAGPNAFQVPYHYRCRPHPVSAAASDEGLAARLWELSGELVRGAGRP